MAGEPLILKYRPEWTALCPFCRRPSTEYHPAERYGRCFDPPEGCGGTWRFEPYTVTLEPVELAPGFVV